MAAWPAGGFMASISEIPDIVIGRLPIYLRALTQLIQQGQEITSSHELGQRLGISSAQIRKDLSHFGEFGSRVQATRSATCRRSLSRFCRLTANGRWWSWVRATWGELSRIMVGLWSGASGSLGYLTMIRRRLARVRPISK